MSLLLIAYLACFVFYMLLLVEFHWRPVPVRDTEQAVRYEAWQRFIVSAGWMQVLVGVLLSAYSYLDKTADLSTDLALTGGSLAALLAEMIYSRSVRRM